MTPCEGEDSVKWNFINSLKEVSYLFLLCAFLFLVGGCCLVIGEWRDDTVHLIWISMCVFHFLFFPLFFLSLLFYYLPSNITG